MIKIQGRPTESTNNEKLLDVTRDINFFFYINITTSYSETCYLLL